jgi:hypothetical protein
MTFKRHLLTSVILITIILISFPGCSTFKSTRKVDLTPFAKHLITMSEDVQYGLSQEKAIWLRRYMDDPDISPLLTEYGDVSDRTRRILRAILAYSIEIVTLAQLDAPGPEKANALAGYLEYLKGPSVDAQGFDVHLTEARFDEIIADIRTRENLIDGINAAQPVADEIARIVGEHIVRVEVLQVRLEEAITLAIEDDHRVQIDFMKTLKAEQSLTFRSMTRLMDYVDGDAEALGLLREEDPWLLRDVPTHRDMTEAETIAVRDRLLQRIDTIEKVRQSLRVDLEDYETELDELHRLVNAHQDALRKARGTALAWAQAHRKLASGVVDPAKIDIFGMARSAVRGAL